jgi:periplasmic protein TonB
MQVPLVELRRHDTDEATAELRLPPVADLGNVVPFRRPHARLAEHQVPEEILAPPDRLLPAARRDRRRAVLFALLVASLALHMALLAVLSRAPPPLPGIELAPITVEIVVSDGARPDAGAGATTPEEEPKGQQQPQQEPTTTQSPPQVIQPTAPETVAKPPEESPPQVSEPEQAQALEPPAKPPEAPVTDRTPPEDKVPAPPELAPQPPIAQQPRPIETAPPRPELSVPTQPREQTEKSPTEPKAAPPPPPKQKPPQSAEPPRPKQAPARENQRPPQGRPDGKARANEAGARSSSGESARRSSADPNYAGTVLAQLARHKRMPAEAQRNHSQGTATVNFMIDGSGRVGAVRIVRSSGVAILDQEALGLPRRASPFPPPPGGRPIPITVPVNFRF